MQHCRIINRLAGSSFVALALLATAGARPTGADPTGTAAAGDRRGAKPDPATMFDGLSRPSNELQLAFALRGKVTELGVAPGERVRTGQVLMRLDDSVQQQMVALAKHRAENDTQIRAAKKTLELREVDYALIQEADRKNSASDADIRTRRLQRDLAQINVEAETRNVEESAISLTREQATLDQMRVVAPIDGVVVDVFKRPGETVDELTKVLLVVSVDPLWFEVNVPAVTAAGIEPGDSASVNWEDLPESPAITGKVIYKSPVSDPGSRKMLVRIELPNPGALPAGLHGKARFGARPAAKPAVKTERGS